MSDLISRLDVIRRTGPISISSPRGVSVTLEEIITALSGDAPVEDDVDTEPVTESDTGETVEGDGIDRTVGGLFNN